MLLTEAEREKLGRHPRKSMTSQGSPNSRQTSSVARMAACALSLGKSARRSMSLLGWMSPCAAMARTLRSHNVTISDTPGVMPQSRLSSAGGTVCELILSVVAAYLSARSARQDAIQHRAYLAQERFWILTHGEVAKAGHGLVAGARNQGRQLGARGRGAAPIVLAVQDVH